MDILLFTNNTRKAEYCALKLMKAGHSVITAETLEAVHRKLRLTDPDFVIVDSETFPDPGNDYRTIIRLCRRKFLLFYDRELVSGQVLPVSGNSAALLQADAPPSAASELYGEQAECLKLLTEVLTDIHVHRTLVSETFSASSPDERQFLKENQLRPPLALLLACFLKNQDTDIDTATLLSLLWADGESSHIQTLYAYMNQLRMLLEARDIPLVIEKRLKGTYRIRMHSELLLSESASVQA